MTMNICKDCGKEFATDPRRDEFFEDICNECADKYYFICGRCRSADEKENGIAFDGDMYCKTCILEMFNLKYGIEHRQYAILDINYNSPAVMTSAVQLYYPSSYDDLRWEIIDNLNINRNQTEGDEQLFIAAEVLIRHHIKDIYNYIVSLLKEDPNLKNNDEIYLYVTIQMK